MTIGTYMTKKSDDFLTSNIKGLLQEKLWLLDARFKQKRLATPYKTLTDAEARILATLRGETLTISEIARRLDLSRQAIHKTVAKLVQAKLLKLEPIPDNARDKRIEFTEKGEAMKTAGYKALQELEKEVETKIGKENLKRLKLLLGKI
jgi:DNA-binding MarR family transcriptional regulator